MFFGDGGIIEYLYDASGIKLQKKVIEGSKTTVTDYLDGYQYVDGVLEFYPHAEGYVKVNENNTLNYVYNYTDHLGNVRVSYTKGSDGNAQIIEESNYYPFGLKHKGYNNQSNQLTDKYKYGYNGKEEQEELGFNTLDFGARFLDPATGRWYNIDALAEKYYTESPYNYALNNPVLFIDPDGNQVELCCEELLNLAKSYYRGLGQGAYNAASNYVEGVKQLVTDPVGTVEQIASDPIGFAVSNLETGVGIASLTTPAGFVPNAEETAQIATGDASGLGERIGENVTNAAITSAEVAVGSKVKLPKLKGSSSKVYRVYGGDAKPEGFSWTPENPGNVKNFRDAAGLPSGGESGATNSARFIIEGTVDNKNIIKKRAALPLDGNKGGLSEYIIDPKNVKVKRVSGVNPEF